MNTYKVTFAPRRDIDNIQRTTTLAESLDEVHCIFEDCEVQEVEELHAVDVASSMDYDTDAEAREIKETISNLEEFTQDDERETQDLYTMGMGG